MEIYRLRDFWASPASGHHAGVRWHQTMGAMVLRMRLHGAPWSGASPSEFQVRLCDVGLRVTNKQRPEASEKYLHGSLDGDFPHEVLVRSSWWSLEADEDDDGNHAQVLIIHLVKAKDKSWKEPFLKGRPAAASNLSSDWVSLQPGCRTPEDTLDEAGLGSLRPQEFLQEISTSQTEDLATIRLVLCQKNLDEAKHHVPMSQLWGLDLTEDSLKVFMRGHEAMPLLDRRLGGKIMPQQTDWAMVKVTRESDTGADGVEARETRPALSIQLRKAAEHRMNWESVLDEGTTVSVAVASNAKTESKLGAIDEGESQLRGSCDEIAKQLKVQGDDSFRKQQWESALEYYTQALGHTPDSEKLLSNRSAVYIELGLCQQALDDAMRCEEISPAWPKAFFRQGVALRTLKRYDMAISAFSEGLSRDPTNPNWQCELEETERLKAARQAARAAKANR